ncbi:MAG: hypothetical protein IJR79_00025 [Clostridia bacterium]|nr:hypothetical protein [Clostridia bacterium]
MNFEKTAKSFKMHFGRNCERICFSGMSVPILINDSGSFCAAVSVGGAMAVAGRRDGRFTTEFDDNQKYISSNILDLKYHTEEPMLALLWKVQKSGIDLCGADVLFEYNTEIYGGYEPLLLSSLYSFCSKMPVPIKMKCCLSNPLKDFVSMVGKRETLLFTEGEKHTYVQFKSSIAKIVLCCFDEENEIGKMGNIRDAASILASGDYARFGEMITSEYTNLLGRNCVRKRTKNLFDLAVRLKDALGLGILESGGIFAVVENKKVSAFVQNLKKEYENYYGTAPDFYITSTENSGIYGTVKKTDL